MNIRTAENLIACHRAGIPTDDSVQKALKMAESDEILRGVLNKNAAFDTQIVDAIHAIKPPESLRKKIAECAAPVELRKHALHPTILCAIAGVLLAIGFGVFLEMEKRAGFIGKEHAERMVDQLGGMTGVEFEIKSGAVSGLADWLMLRGFDEVKLPADISSLPVAGARTTQFAEHPIAQIAIEKHAMILNVFRVADFEMELPEDGDWKVFKQKEWAAAIRQRRGICTLLAFRGSVEEMQEFVLSLTP